MKRTLVLQLFDFQLRVSHNLDFGGQLMRNRPSCESVKVFGVAGVVYVALSRVRTLGGLCLLNFDPRCIKVKKISVSLAKKLVSHLQTLTMLALKCHIRYFWYFVAK